MATHVEYMELVLPGSTEATAALPATFPPFAEEEGL